MSNFNSIHKPKGVQGTDWDYDVINDRYVFRNGYNVDLLAGKFDFTKPIHEVCCGLANEVRCATGEGKSTNPVEVYSTAIIRTLRLQSWESAKAGLMGVIHTYYSSTEKSGKVVSTINEFIKTIEDMKI